MTTRRRATRHISATPRATLVQWWTVRTARAASTEPSARERASAAPRTHGAAPPGRWATMTALGSTPTTVQHGSFDPVPDPTETTDATSARASQT